MTTFPLVDNHPDPLESFKDAASSIDAINALVTSTRHAFQHIEPWAHAQTISLHPAVRDIVVAVKENAIVYFSAIDMSITASQAGASFADDAISLCEAIVDEAPLSSIITFIEDMQQVAKQARSDAQDMFDKFRSVRRGFFNITNKISQASDKVFRDTQKAQASQRRHERGGSIAGTISGAALQANNFVAAAAGIVSIDGGCLSILIPALLPIVAFIASRIEHGCINKAEARRTKSMSCMEAAMQLERIGGDMDGLLKHISGFSTWWSHMYAVLDSLKANVAHLQSSHLDMRRVKVIQRKWSTVQAQYHTYGVEISTLQDFYPALYLRSKSHLSDGLSIRLEPTISSLAVQVEQCRMAIHALHLTSINARGKYSARLRGSLDEIKPHLKNEWTCLLDHLQLVVDLGYNIADAYEHPDSSSNSAQYGDSRGSWTLAVDELAKTCQAVVDRHTAVRNKFHSERDTISKCLTKSASSWRAKGLRHATRESSLRSGADSSDDEVDQRPVDYIGRRLDSLQDDCLKVLTSLETVLTDIGSSLQDMASFWRVRSTGLPSSLKSSSPSTGLRGKTFTICDFEPIDHHSISTSSGSIITSLDALVVDIPLLSMPTGAKDNKERFLPHLPTWLRT